jgi:two-component system, chemotaxis family, sensor kinase CheA
MRDDPYKYFRIEARELLERLGKDVLELERACTPALISRLLRYAHTLKGAARVVKQLQIADAAHQLEEHLAPHRDNRVPLPSESVNAMLALLDKAGAHLAAIDAAPPAAASPETQTPEVQNAASVAPSSSTPQLVRSVRADVEEIDVVVDAVGAALSELNSLRGLIGKLEELRQLAELCTRQLAAPRKHEPRAGAGTLDKVRSLTETLSQETRELDAGMTASLERARRELEHARAQAEQLRLSPASLMFTALERAVRDAAQELGKQVRVETRGGEIRLDGSVLEVVQAGLFHVVRNAVAHGIEAGPQRRAAGKPAAGTIRIEVGRQGPRVLFRCTDDGAGLNVAEVRRALTRAGKQLPPLSELGVNQLLELLLRSGVSTAGQVTAVSGRGVGLDVIREAAERLNGTLRFDSQPGNGFVVELVVPVSMAALDALAVESDGELCSLPLDAVRRSVRLQSSEVASSAAGQSLVHEGKVLPFLPLSRALRGEHTGRIAAHTTAVIVHSAAGALALGVDRVLGIKTVVLRKLPALLPRNPLLAGAALDALGNPELVLDPEGLYAAAQRPESAQTAAFAPRLPVLIIDDSLTTRMLEQSILESAGYRVVLACSGEEGLHKAREGRYGLFLVDVEMPGMDGFGFVEATRRDPELQKVPAVLVSSRDAPEDLARGKAAGASGYIVKGRFDQRELLGLIGKLLGSG